MSQDWTDERSRVGVVEPGQGREVGRLEIQVNRDSDTSRSASPKLFHAEATPAVYVLRISPEHQGTDKIRIGGCAVRHGEPSLNFLRHSHERVRQDNLHISIRLWWERGGHPESLPLSKIPVVHLVNGLREELRDPRKGPGANIQERIAHENAAAHEVCGGGLIVDHLAMMGGILPTRRPRSLLGGLLCIFPEVVRDAEGCRLRRLQELSGREKPGLRELGLAEEHLFDTLPSHGIMSCPRSSMARRGRALLCLRCSCRTGRVEQIEDLQPKCTCP
mmetsp:Transcript_14880/g.56399  ORF Transcript_14880/g.56399 Transcript_14880/m.56399 type:complete len:276 (-) Transcript_14880:3358-4185(-)